MPSELKSSTAWKMSRNVPKVCQRLPRNAANFNPFSTANDSGSKQARALGLPGLSTPRSRHSRRSIVWTFQRLLFFRATNELRAFGTANCIDRRVASEVRRRRSLHKTALVGKESLEGANAGKSNDINPRAERHRSRTTD